MTSTSVRVIYMSSKNAGKLSKKDSEKSSDKKFSSSQSFVDFIRDQVGTLGTLTSSIPLLMDYGNLITAPNRALVFITSIICAVIFFGVFWSRNKILAFARKVKINSILFGIVSTVIGILLVLLYEEYAEQNWKAQELIHILLQFSYVAGFAMLVAGISLVFVTGYSQEEERRLIVNQSLAAMTPEQWNFTQNLIVSLKAIHETTEDEAIPKEATTALRGVAQYFYNYSLDIFKDIERNRSIVVPGPGPLMNKVYSTFMNQAHSFKALSCDDLDFWDDTCQSDIYLTREEEKNVERIFVFPKKVYEANEDRIKNVLMKQIRQICFDRKPYRKLFLAILEDLPSEIPGNKMDFGLLFTSATTPFATTYWRGERGAISREFQIKIDPDECKEYCDYFNMVKSKAFPKGDRAIEDFQGIDNALIAVLKSIKHSSGALP